MVQGRSAYTAHELWTAVHCLPRSEGNPSCRCEARNPQADEELQRGQGRALYTGRARSACEQALMMSWQRFQQLSTELLWMCS